MNAQDYQSWMEKAFLFVEAALAQELATPSRLCMTEDYLRSSLVRGLAASMPELAGRIRTEEDAVWTGNSCWHCRTTEGQRRPIQHDVAVAPGADDGGLICEVKWLKSANATAVARDVWKLALSRETTPEQQAVRAYLLIGGESDAFSGTFKTLSKNHVNFRWSNAGRQKGKPGTQHVSLLRFLETSMGDRQMRELLRWGSSSHHFRQPPNCWAAMRIARRFDPWLRTIDGYGWRAALFEIHHHGAKSNDFVDWTALHSSLPFGC